MSTIVGNLSYLNKKIQIRAIIEFERRFMGSVEKDIFDHQSIESKETHLHDSQLTYLLLNPCTKRNTSIIFREMWNEERETLKK